MSAPERDTSKRELEDVSAEHTAKRRRPDVAPSIDVVIAQPHVLRALVDAVVTVLKEVEFEVCSDGLQVGATDDKGMCLVEGRVRCEVNCGVGDFLRIKADALLRCLKSVSAHYIVRLQAAAAQGDDPGWTRILAYESSRQNDKATYAFKTLPPSKNRSSLRALPDLTRVDIEMAVLRKAVKQCKDLKAPATTLKIDRNFVVIDPGTGASVGIAEIDQGIAEIDPDNVKCEYTLHVLAAGEDVACCRSFKSMIPADATQPTTEASICSESFATEYLHGFLRSLDRKMATLTIGDGAPLSVECPIDPSGAYVRFTLAPTERAVGRL
jgi:hypothetical protein